LEAATYPRGLSVLLRRIPGCAIVIAVVVLSDQSILEYDYVQQYVSLIDILIHLS
jgi:hypothetical protein